MTYCVPTYSRCAGTLVDLDLCLQFKLPDKIGLYGNNGTLWISETLHVLLQKTASYMFFSLLAVAGNKKLVCHLEVLLSLIAEAICVLEAVGANV